MPELATFAPITAAQAVHVQVACFYTSVSQTYLSVGTVKKLNKFRGTTAM